MTESIVTLLNTLNALSPLAVIGLLSVIIYVIVYKQPSKRELNIIKHNDLHYLPEMAETLRRMEVTMGENFAHIRARLNGRT